MKKESHSERKDCDVYITTRAMLQHNSGILGQASNVRLSPSMSASHPKSPLHDHHNEDSSRSLSSSSTSTMRRTSAARTVSPPNGQSRQYPVVNSDNSDHDDGSSWTSTESDLTMEDTKKQRSPRSRLFVSLLGRPSKHEHWCMIALKTVVLCSAMTVFFTASTIPKVNNLRGLMEQEHQGDSATTGNRRGLKASQQFPSSLSSINSLFTANVPQADSNDSVTLLDVLIIGAGWAGIGAAHELHTKSPQLQVQVLEAYHAVGGRSRTIYPFPGKAQGYAVEVGSAWTYEGTAVHKMMLDLPEPHYGQIHYDEDFRTLGLYVEDAGKTRAISGAEFQRLTTDLWMGKFAPFFRRARHYLHMQKTDKSYQQVLNEFYQLHGYVDTQDPVKQLEQRFLEIMVHAQLEIEHAGPLNRLSTEHYGTSSNECLFCDADYLVPGDGGGFDKIMKSQVDPIRHKILVNHTVTKVEYSWKKDVPTKVSYTYQDANGKVMEGTKWAKKVIVTVPLGVLKKGTIEFVPPLPPKKQNAIDYIGFGVLNKVVLYWDSDQSSWWPQGQELISLMPQNVNDTGKYNTFFNDREIGNGGHFVLSAWTGGDPAARYEEEWTDEQIQTHVMQNLRSMFGPHVPEPAKYILSRWGQDPLAYGSYSWDPVGTKHVAAQKRRDLAETVGNLYWAGEATSLDWFGTTVGALESGQDAALEIMGIDDE